MHPPTLIEKYAALIVADTPEALAEARTLARSTTWGELDARPDFDNGFPRTLRAAEASGALDRKVTAKLIAGIEEAQAKHREVRERMAALESELAEATAGVEAAFDSAGYARQQAVMFMFVANSCCCGLARQIMGEERYAEAMAVAAETQKLFDGDAMNAMRKAARRG